MMTVMLAPLLRWLAIILLCLTVLGDADFESVRTKMRKDRSGKGGDPKDKYFHESVFHPHYDGRFSDRQLQYEERNQHLVALTQTYLATMADLGVETWVMHGTLLGWWWNQKILPWDSDLDVQVDERTMHFLASYYNMTEYHYKLSHVPEGRNYLLEINPRYKVRGTEDKLNVIDARWIDTDTGLFIDITTVRRNYTAIEEGIEGALMCKDKHHYLEKDIFPLRESTFEGESVKIPYEYVKLLDEEYGKKSMTLTTYERHKFNETSMLWEPQKGRRPLPGGRRRPRPKRPRPTLDKANLGRGR